MLSFGKGICNDGMDMLIRIGKFQIVGCQTLLLLRMRVIKLQISFS